MSDTARERLRRYLIHKGISQTKFAADAGLSSAYVTAIRDTMHPNTLHKIATAYPDLDIKWLLYGEGEMLKPTTKTTDDKGRAIVEVAYLSVSMQAVYAETLTIADDSRYPVLLTSAERKEAQRYIVVEVESDSMSPQIAQGALILARRVDTERWHYTEGVSVVVFDQHVAVRRIAQNNLLTNGTITLRSDSERYGDLLVKRTDIRAIYKAKRIVSSNIK